MLNTYAVEFAAIVKNLLKDPNVKRKGSYLIVAKDTVVALLNHNAYETANNKLKIWKGLNWLDAEDNRLTKRVYDRETGKQRLRLKIDLGVYQTLRKLL